MLAAAISPSSFILHKRRLTNGKRTNKKAAAVVAAVVAAVAAAGITPSRSSSPETLSSG